MRARGANAVYLPDVRFPSNLSVTDDLAAALAGTEFIVSAVPSHGTREILRRAGPHVHRGATIVSATKGLEQDTLLRVSEIMTQELGDVANVAVLSGPSFAAELARELPTAVSIASRDSQVVQRVQQEFRAPYLRLYGTDDVVGVEIGGALKNIIAIAAGMVEGLGLGHNALAGLITRGLAEMSRLACAAGAKRETLSGLTGLGDLVLTCTGDLSRNRRVGLALARGASLAAALDELGHVAEGVPAAAAVRALSRHHGVEMPICDAVYRVVYEGEAPRDAVLRLLQREPRSEQQ